MDRRNFIFKSTAVTAGLAAGVRVKSEPEAAVLKANIVNPLNCVPVSMIIDDSTALVNMAHYGIPQFHEVFPDQYPQDWRKLPREIPDSFVREFGEWCRDHGIKGKYSMVPYPACTGWLNRFIPGWTKKELQDSLALVREFMMPDWDIHPEMISHTRVINLKTGQPYPEAIPEFMENWEWSQNKSADELGSYLAYALNILKDAGLPCEGITTPGGFGSRNIENLALATLQSVRDVFKTDVPHFFRDVLTDPGTHVEPQLFHVSGLETNDPKCSVHIIGCTDDWFGGWDGLAPGNADLMITSDLQKGRLVEVIDRKEPAILVCHWPGIYYNGEKTGFNIFKEVVSRLNQKYNNLIWMKNSEIARYWAAKKLTVIEPVKKGVQLKAPFATKNFTLQIGAKAQKVTVQDSDNTYPLERVNDILQLKQGSFCPTHAETYIVLDLKKGMTTVEY